MTVTDERLPQCRIKCSEEQEHCEWLLDLNLCKVSLCGQQIRDAVEEVCESVSVFATEPKPKSGIQAYFWTDPDACDEDALVKRLREVTDNQYLDCEVYHDTRQAPELSSI